jgi:hypothetical protein
MTQAPIEPRHKDEAAKAADWLEIARAEQYISKNSREYISILAHAQTLANLEAARAENEAFKREVSDAMVVIDQWARHGVNTGPIPAGDLVRKYIIPASDPVVEKWKEMMAAWAGVEPSYYDEDAETTEGQRAIAKFRAFIEGGS